MMKIAETITQRGRVQNEVAIIGKTIKTLIKILVSFKKIKSDYRKNINKLQSYDFWIEYLSLGKENKMAIYFICFGISIIISLFVINEKSYIYQLSGEQNQKNIYKV